MSDWMETFIISLAVLLIFVLGIGIGYSLGTKDMADVIARNTGIRYEKLEADLKEAVTQRDECRRFVREWAAPIRPVKK